MRRDLPLLILLTASLTATACSVSPTRAPVTEPPRSITAEESALIESDNLFGLKLFSAVSEEEGDKNIFLSPLSIAMALGMTLNGADGDTYDAMRETLELTGLTEEEINRSYRSLIDLLTAMDPKVIFQIANSIWYRDTFPIDSVFVSLNSEYFDAEVEGLDFSAPGAAGIINAWVDEKTNGRIEEIVDDPIEAMTVMFLINAIYFKGDWTYQFDLEDTQDAPFTLSDGSTKQVPTMYLSDISFPYYNGESYQAVDLAYGDSLFSMTIILPDPDTDLDSLIESLNRAEWEEIIGLLSPVELDFLRMPKFTLEYEIKLNDVLTALGMGIAFDQALADFSRMYSGELIIGNLFISSVKHKSFIEVNEEGTEAAAVTSVEVGLTSVGQYMAVDRPFLFAIRDRHSGTILFIGKIVDPAP